MSLPRIGMGVFRAMAQKRNKIGIDVIPPSAEQGVISPRADAAIRSLARLIGRQIAREQFERKLEQERKALKKQNANRDR